ncbi:4247_t:CDS:2 [Paraglomus occultum]|uniref:4247_t:CDS:1 n=1 Tax=Paraglomus occultum TaxID=144539 RepID=A0A9N8ZFL6_9GLOM|nr:4247_t:CDS:2 [Paraglomus occultum]
MCTPQSKPNGASNDSVNIRQSSSASEKATENWKKLKQSEGSFLKAIAKLTRSGDKLNDLVSQVYLELDSDPLHPLYEHFDRFPAILTCLCAKNQKTRERMGCDLMQLVAEHLFPRSNVYTSTSLPNPNTNTSVTSDSQKRSASCEPTVIDKRSIKRPRVGPYEKVMDFGNSTKEMQKGNTSATPNGHDGQAVSFIPSATEEQQLPQLSRMQQTPLTSGLIEVQEGNVPTVGSILITDMIGGGQLQPLPYVQRTDSGYTSLYADSFGTIYSSPPSYNTDGIASQVRMIATSQDHNYHLLMKLKYVGNVPEIKDITRVQTITGNGV